jgi:hypothetical protein
LRISGRALSVGTGLAVALIAVALASCGGPVDTTPLAARASISPTPSPAPSPTPTPTPTATASPGAVLLSATTIAFTATGALNAQMVTASQSNYGGIFGASTPSTGSGSCSGIASASPATGSAFTVTPNAAGQCAFTITGANGQNATLTVVVTTTTFGGI